MRWKVLSVQRLRWHRYVWTSSYFMAHFIAASTLLVTLGPRSGLVQSWTTEALSSLFVGFRQYGFVLLLYPSRCCSGRFVVAGFGLYTRRTVRRLSVFLHERMYWCMVVDPGFSQFRPIYRSLFCSIWSLPSQRVCHISVSWWRCRYQYKSVDTLWFLCTYVWYRWYVRKELLRKPCVGCDSFAGSRL